MASKKEIVLNKNPLYQEVSASLLSADFSRLREEIIAVQKAGAHRLHIDVMDGHFVPNLTIGPPVVKSLKAISALPLDIHLMVQEPEKMIIPFVKAGSHSITFHIEATKRPRDLLEHIKAQKVLAGMALKPATPQEKLFPYLPYLDFVLVMTVEPGFGGQTLLIDQVKKIASIKEEIKKQGLKNIRVHVDGGVNDKTRPLLASADVLVSGNFIFSHKNYKTAITLLRNTHDG